jgi:hypothetical protein
LSLSLHARASLAEQTALAGGSSAPRKPRKKPKVKPDKPDPPKPK